MDDRHFHVESWGREALAALTLAGLVLLVGTVVQVLRIW